MNARKEGARKEEREEGREGRGEAWEKKEEQKLSAACSGGGRKVTLSSSAQPTCPFSLRGQFAGDPAPAEGSYSQVMPLARGRDLLPPHGGEATLCN